MGDEVVARRHLAKAVELARRRHDGQLDKAGEPYFGHVERVMARVRQIAPTELAIVAETAAALHDVVEDCGVSFQELHREGFSSEVVSAVDSVTGREGEDYEQLVRRAAADPVGRWVKLADNLDNSDPGRLAKLDAPTRSRLEEKYRRAREILAEAGAEPPGE